MKKYLFVPILTLIVFTFLYGCGRDSSDTPEFNESQTESGTLSDSEESLNTERPVLRPSDFDFETYFLADNFKAEKGIRMAYRLYLPKDYNENNEYPLLVYLHSDGLQGRDNEKPLTEAGILFENPSSPVYESIVLVPQCPVNSSWNIYTLDSLVQLVDYVNSLYSTDTERQYWVGVSMGSDAIWQLMENYPNMVSAVVCTIGNNLILLKYPDGSLYPIGMDEKMADISKCFICRAENYPSAETYFSLLENTFINNGVKNINFKKVQADVENIESVTLNDISVIDWLFEQNRVTSKNAKEEVDDNVSVNNTYFVCNDEFEFSEFTASNGITLPYRYYLPENYDESKEYPVLMFLHSNGIQGNDNIQHMYLLDQLFANEESPVFESIVVAPQCPKSGWWSGEYNDAVIELFAHINKKYSTDLSRQYLTGVSMGGSGTWDILNRYPDAISGAVPVAGNTFGLSTNADGTFSIVGFNQKTLKVPICYVYDTIDEYSTKVYQQSIVKILTDYGATNFTYRETNKYGHNICTRYVTASDISVLEWLYSQRRDTSVPIEPDPPMFEE